MASGLAARIKEIFGTAPQLVEGHDGIYEISIKGQVAVTNQGKCSGIPTEDEILSAVRKYMPPLAGKEKMIRATLRMA